MKVLRVVEADDPEHCPLIVKRWGDIENVFCPVEDDTENIKYLVTVVEMSKKEIDELPEWDGF